MPIPYLDASHSMSYDHIRLIGLHPTTTFIRTAHTGNFTTPNQRVSAPIFASRKYVKKIALYKTISLLGEQTAH